MSFSELKAKFDKENMNAFEYNCFLPVHLTYNQKTSLKKTNGTNNEEFYKWQFLYALVNSSLVAKDYIGTEIHFPKGNKSSSALKIDAAIFDNKEWFEHYSNYHKNNDMDSLEWLRDHMIAVIEFKKKMTKTFRKYGTNNLKHI